MSRWTYLLAFVLILAFLFQVGCALLPFGSRTPVPTGVLVYDAPVSLTVRSGALLPGTPIGYGGKTNTGAAKVIVSDAVAIKQVADSLDWEGVPLAGVKLRLSTRVASFDDQAITFIGTAHLEIENVVIQPGPVSNQPQLEFSAPLTYTVLKNTPVPGTNLFYVGSSGEGARFAGVEGIPYRKNFDSLQYAGKIQSFVFLRLDLRILNYSDSSVTLSGTANLRIDK